MNKIVLLLVCFGLNSQASEFIYNLTSNPTPGDSCKKECTINADCGMGAYCDQNVCRYSVYFCTFERWSFNSRGESKNCDAYQCNQKNGLCKTEATQSTDCTYGYIFDGKNKCVKTVNCNSADPDCSKLLQQWDSARKSYEVQTPQPQFIPLSCKTCSVHADCGDGEMCWNAHCVNDAKYCVTADNGEEVSVTKDGVQDHCGTEGCDKITGSCVKPSNHF